MREHFHPADDFSSMLTSEQGPETCNTYNMLRLTKMLYETSADAHLMDYYERALYNHILPHKILYKVVLFISPRCVPVIIESTRNLRPVSGVVWDRGWKIMLAMVK